MNEKTICTALLAVFFLWVGAYIYVDWSSKSQYQQYIRDSASTETPKTYSDIEKKLDAMQNELKDISKRNDETRSLGDAVFQYAFNEACTMNGHLASDATPETDRRQCLTSRDGLRAVANGDYVLFFKLNEDGRAIRLHPFVKEGDPAYLDVPALKASFNVTP